MSNEKETFISCYGIEWSSKHAFDFFAHFNRGLCKHNGVSESDRHATIQSMIGSVKVRKGDAAVWKDAKPKMSITEKDAIRTFVESQAEILTSEGSVIRLDENTTMEMATFNQNPNGSQTTKVAVLSGTLLSNVKKLINTGSKFEFETPTATASIRGTRVGLEVTSDKTSIKVYEGK